MQNKKVKIKLSNNDAMNIIWLMTAEKSTAAFCSKARIQLMIQPFQKVLMRLESNKWKGKYTLSLHVTEAAMLYTVLFPLKNDIGSSMWNTQQRVLDAIDKVHAYSTSETKLYEKVHNPQ